MTTGYIGAVTVDGKDIEVVKKFVFLGAMITEDGLCEKEVRRRIAMGKAAMGGLTSIWKDIWGRMVTKVTLVKVLVFPIVMYRAETWKMRKHERRKIDAFELWCWRRVLRVSWMERKTNISIIESIKPEWTLESMVTEAALSYFGHVVRAGGMEDDMMLGRMNGAWNRGRPRQRWLDTLKEYASGATINNMRWDARDRAGWRYRSYHGCRQGSDATRRHKVTRWFQYWISEFRCLFVNVVVRLLISLYSFMYFRYLPVLVFARSVGLRG